LTPFKEEGEKGLGSAMARGPSQMMKDEWDRKQQSRSGALRPRHVSKMWKAHCLTALLEENVTNEET